MTQWLNVRASDDRILGWQRGPAMPAPAEGMTQVEDADGTLLAQYEAARAGLAADHREPAVYWREGAIATDPDTRPTVRVVVDKTIVAVGETITFTVSMLDGSGDVASGFGQTIILPVLDKLWKLDFAGGVAVKSFQPSTSGVYTINSTPDMKIETPITLQVVE